MRFDLVELGAYIEVQGGYAYKSDDFQGDGDFPVIKIKNVRFGDVDYSESSFINSKLADETIDWKTSEGDILISMTGSGPNAPNSLVGRVARIWEGEPDAWINQRVGRILLKKENEIHPDFIFYLLSSSDTQHYLVSNSTGSANQANISGKLIETVPCPNVDHETSKKIAEQLKTLDQKIHLNQQTNETLEAMVQAIFKSWFVDFDPVRAKIEAISAGRDPNNAAMATIAGVSLEQDWDEIEMELQQKLGRMSEAQRTHLRQTAELFPDELVESEIGVVPKGWGVANYGKLIEFMIGGDWGKEEPTKKHTERVRIFRGTDLPEIFQGNDESVPVRFVQSKKLKTRKLQHGDIVFEVSGGSKNQSTGRNLLITEKLIKRFGSDLEPASFCKLMRPASIELSYYLGVYLRKAYDDDLMWQFQVQSTGISNFQTSTFMEQHNLVVPSDQTLKQFQNIVEPIFDKIYNDENSELKKLRDTLLPKLISGDLEI